MHKLVVEVFEGENSNHEYDRWIKHDENCPLEERGVDPLSGEVWEEYTCGVGYWSENYGFEDLADEKEFNTPGEHEIDFYSYTPDSFFEEADAYLYFVRDKNA